MTDINGVLNIFKPAGMTSHDVVGRVRRILHEKRVGHAGTLDPAAIGVLPVCVGQATRLVEYLTDARKIYCAEVRLGITTDTYDREGRVTSTAPVADFSLEEVDRAAEILRGSILQIPPIYSAIKVGGQPLYKAARAGTADSITLTPRPVQIYKLAITRWENPWLRLWVECSKGTYIRSLVYDLGQQLGCGAFMHDLVRIQSGPFHLKDAVSFEQLEQAGAELLQPLDLIIQDWPVWVLDDPSVERIRQGRNFSLERTAGYNSQNTANNELPFRRAYDRHGKLIALLERAEQEWHPAKVFQG